MPDSIALCNELMEFLDKLVTSSGRVAQVAKWREAAGQLGLLMTWPSVRSACVLAPGSRLPAHGLQTAVDRIRLQTIMTVESCGCSATKIRIDV